LKGKLETGWKTAEWRLGWTAAGGLEARRSQPKKSENNEAWGTSAI